MASTNLRDRIQLQIERRKLDLREPIPLPAIRELADTVMATIGDTEDAIAELRGMMVQGEPREGRHRYVRMPEPWDEPGCNGTGNGTEPPLPLRNRLLAELERRGLSLSETISCGKEIAEVIGTTAQTVSVYLADLRREAGVKVLRTGSRAIAEPPAAHANGATPADPEPTPTQPAANASTDETPLEPSEPAPEAKPREESWTIRLIRACIAERGIDLSRPLGRQDAEAIAATVGMSPRSIAGYASRIRKLDGVVLDPAAVTAKARQCGLLGGHPRRKSAQAPQPWQHPGPRVVLNRAREVSETVVLQALDLLTNGKTPKAWPGAPIAERMEILDLAAKIGRSL